MERDLIKTSSLIRFYYNKGTPISFALKNKRMEITGIIKKKSLFGPSNIILEDKNGIPIKIFVEDIEPGSIIPSSYSKNKIKNNRSSLSPKLRAKILKRDRNTCMSCGARAPDVELEVDHIIPVSRGGSDDPSNLRTTCKECNRGKGNDI